MGDSSSRRQSSGTNRYRGKSDSLYTAETQQIEHEQEVAHNVWDPKMVTSEMRPYQSGSGSLVRVDDLNSLTLFDV
jgi:hypothetical protein